MAVGPRALQAGQRVVGPPWPSRGCSTDPTVMADGALPGDWMPHRMVLPSAVLPVFPADTTTTMPAVDRPLNRLHQWIIADRLEDRMASDRLMTRMR